MKILPGKEAIMLLFTEKALVLDASYTTYGASEWIKYSESIEDPDMASISSVNFKMIVPEIIVLPKYLRKVNRTKKVKYSRSAVFARDSNICQYCGKTFKKAELTVDHIIPRCKGGRSNWMNITTACKPCNSSKADKTPEEAKMKLLNPPRIPTWKDSLTTSDGHLKVFGQIFCKKLDRSKCLILN